MTKKELIEKVAKVSCDKKEATAAVNTVFDSIRKALKKGEPVSIFGFGTFNVVKRAARKGRNPRTGETVKVKAKKTPRFKAGVGLKNYIK
jgi:nucleoid DNA-binding protein